MTKLTESQAHDTGDIEAEERAIKQLSQSEQLPKVKIGGFPCSSETIAGSPAESSTSKDRRSQDHHHSSILATSTSSPIEPRTPVLTLEEPTPTLVPVQDAELTKGQIDPTPATTDHNESPSSLRPSSASRTNSRPTVVSRKQSLVTASNAPIIKSLLDSDVPLSAGLTAPSEYTGGPGAFSASMLHRKIWVRRPNASATLVQIREDDLVDDVRDMILRKYGNSLGKSFDAPDVTLRIYPRDAENKTGDRTLRPDEEMCRTLDAYYPGGQTLNEALLIEVPQRRTPRPSPRAMQHGHVPYYYHHDDTRPLENAQEYFPPMPIVHPSPAALTTHSHESRTSLSHAPPPPHSIAILQTGQLPPLPSPGSTRRGHRPKYPRHNTASPTALHGGPPVPAASARPTTNRPRQDSSASETKHSTTGNPPIPTPPAPEVAVPGRQGSTPPIPHVTSPRLGGKRKKQKAAEGITLPAGLLDGSVPPINVLIVEDNIINLRVLGAFMQRLKVRWQRAMNGKEAVEKWRAGGFHLVLMDIQLPIMNGLEATKEIRRLERVNGIGVFSSGSAEAPNHKLSEARKQGRGLEEEDKLGDSNLFKSPVIIVALTASSLQSDRHEALAAGCNDFLTKPVNFVWLERKVKEWGCMQALIDFDGWRKWKDFAAQSDTTESTSKLSSSFSSTAPRSKAKANASPTSATNPGNTGTANGVGGNPKTSRERMESRRRSIGLSGPPPVLEEQESATPPPESDDRPVTFN
ncbi:hypothetical protein GQ43DRAFT_369364 [Delitschia confertaspora ATCC 74209]|uniref:Response regulatory domain-containing protein n=1 Tax=Delitschia confertaspora ATCC 74209 TaxID=1513339 RepID=A0A9P4JMU6_9PLEO|nr:hypothetical protein GQ43DRAFT_369364 [Delitschia confertaspora ATCC 74209]